MEIAGVVAQGRCRDEEAVAKTATFVAAFLAAVRADCSIRSGVQTALVVVLALALEVDSAAEIGCPPVGIAGEVRNAKAQGERRLAVAQIRQSDESSEEVDSEIGDGSNHELALDSVRSVVETDQHETYCCYCRNRPSQSPRVGVGSQTR